LQSADESLPITLHDSQTRNFGYFIFVSTIND
jgi:hypothetical protein